MSLTATSFKLTSKNLNTLLNELKTKYDLNSITDERKAELTFLVQKYGYLPYPHVKALKELTPAETIFILIEKLKLNNIYNDNGFHFEENEISAVQRAGCTDGS